MKINVERLARKGTVTCISLVFEDLFKTEGCIRPLFLLILQNITDASTEVQGKMKHGPPALCYPAQQCIG